MKTHKCAVVHYDVNIKESKVFKTFNDTAAFLLVVK